MAEGSVYFDASAYMLFEASGDSSETQYHDGAFELESESAAEEEDDALSCSYGSAMPAGRVHEVDSGGGGGDLIRGGDNDDRGGSEEAEEKDSGGCGEEEDGVVDQCCRRGTATVVEENPVKSKGREDSNVKMSEMEGDRLFWESCLAS